MRHLFHLVTHWRLVRAVYDGNPSALIFAGFLLVTFAASGIVWWSERSTRAEVLASIDGEGKASEG